MGDHLALLSSRPWSPVAPPEAGKLVRDLFEATILEDPERRTHAGPLSQFTVAPFTLYVSFTGLQSLVTVV
jgi:hypothetical protein